MRVALLVVLHAAAFMQPAVALRSGAGEFRRKFAINLDLPPEERWREVVHEYRDILPAMLVGLELQLWPTVPHVTEGHDAVAMELHSKTKSESHWLRHHRIPVENLVELVGIAKHAANKEVTLRRLILFQFMSEILKGRPETQSRGSVGVLAADANGTVFHGWNTEYNTFNFIALGKRMSLADLALELFFTRGGKLIYSGVGFPGRVGVFAGKRMLQPGLTLQALPSTSRTPKEERFNGGLVDLLVRDALGSSLDFTSMIKFLERSPLYEAATFSVAGSGPWEGAIVEKEKAEPALVLGTSKTTGLSPVLGQWFLVKGCLREKECSDLVQGIEQEAVSASSLLTVLRTSPLFGDGTLFSQVEVPAGTTHALYLAKDTLPAKLLETESTVLESPTWK